MFRYWPAHLTTSLFGDYLWAARLPGMVALAVSTWFAVIIGERLVGEKGRWAGVFFIGNPWVLVWFGRVMPECWLITGILGAFASVLAKDSRKIWFWPLAVGVALLSKPVGVFALLSLFYVRKDHAGFFLGIFGVSLLGLWVTWGVWIHGFYSLEHRLAFEKPFQDPFRMILMAGIIGGGVASWIGLRYAHWREFTILGITGGYALIDSIPNHGYYALPFVALAAIFAVRGLTKENPRVIVAGSFIFAFIALSITGDLGDRRATILDDMPNETISTQRHIALIIEPYGTQNLFFDQNNSNAVRESPSGYYVNTEMPDDCQIIAERSYLGKKLWGYYCPVYNGSFYPGNA